MADLFVVLDSVTDPFSKGLKEATADAEAESSKMSRALKGVATVGIGIGAAVVGVGVASADMAIKFQSSMATLTTQAGVAKNQIAGLSSGVLSLAGQVGFSPDSLAQALYHIESSFQSVGITGPKALDLLKIAAEGAAVGHADLVDVTNALDAAVASGIPGVQDFSQAMGVLNATVGAGDMTMQDLANAFSTGLLANVKSYGLSITDVGAALAVFGDNNIRGQNAATDFRMAVQALAVPANSAAKMLDKMGMSSTTLADVMSKHGLLPALELLKTKLTSIGVTTQTQGEALTEMFGKKAGAGITVLYDQLDRLKSKYPDEIKGAHGFADAWAQTKATVSQQFNEIKAGADALGIRLGQALLPQLSKLITEGQSALGQITSGFDGKAVQGPTVHMGNAHLNQEMAPVTQSTTMLERFGQTLHNALDNAEKLLGKLEPVGKDFGRFADDLWQGGQKIVTGLEPTAKLLGEGLYVGFVAVGKVLADVVGPAFKWFGDFIDSHKGLIEAFTAVTLGGLILKMTILGGINAAESVVKLATAIVGFPLSQTGQIGSAIKDFKTALNGSEIKDGEQDVKGLKTAITDLKGAVGGVFERFPLFDSGKLAALSKAGQDIGGIEKAVGSGEQLGLFEADMNGIVQVAERSPEQLALFEVGVANVGTSAVTAEAGAGSLLGTLGKFALAGGIVGAIVGGAALIGTTLGKLAGVGSKTSTSLDEMVTQLQTAAQGSTQAGQTLAASVVVWSRAGTMGAAGVTQVDQALTQLVTSGHAADAQTEFNAIASALEASGMSAADAAAKFPGFERAIKDMGAAAQTTDSQVSSMLGTISAQQALNQFQSDLENVTSSVKSNGKALAGNTQAAQLNQSAFITAATDIGNYYQQQRSAGVPITQATSDMQKQVVQLEQTGISAGLTKGQVDQYLKTLGLIKPGYATTITADTNPAYAALNRLMNKINTSVGSITVTTVGSGVGNVKGDIARRASGGPVAQNNTYWVGENGPELVTFGASGYVTPTNMLQPAVLAGAHGGGGRGAGGGGTIVYQTNVNVAVAGTVTSEQKLVNAIRTQILQYNVRNSANGLSLGLG